VRVVFFGTPEIAVPSLAAVAERNDVVAVVCQPDRPKGRGKKLEPAPVKQWAEPRGIPVRQPAKLNDGVFETWLREQAPDLCAVAAYGRILKAPLLAVPPNGYLNMHPSLLPRWRGPSPIQSALLHGDSVTGVSIMRVTLEMDAGDILIQEEQPILPDDTAGSLGDRLARQGGRMLADGIDRIARGDAEFVPQDHEAAVHCHLFDKQDGRIDWREPAPAIHNRVRAAHPWPVAWARLDDTVYRIHESAPVNGEAGSAPGTVLAVETAGPGRIVVAAGEGAVALLRLQAPGKKPLPAADFLRGRPIQPGQQFEVR
jgi:methionyl-tRNA formyltransferase